MSVHTDYAGPYLFVGGPADGQRRSVNASRDTWIIPGAIRATATRYDYDPGDTMVEDRPTVYHKRALQLGNGERLEVTVMVSADMPGPQAYRRALELIAALANGGDRS